MRISNLRKIFRIAFQQLLQSHLKKFWKGKQKTLKSYPILLYPLVKWHNSKFPLFMAKSATRKSTIAMAKSWPRSWWRAIISSISELCRGRKHKSLSDKRCSCSGDNLPSEKRRWCLEDPGISMKNHHSTHPKNHGKHQQVPKSKNYVYIYVLNLMLSCVSLIYHTSDWIQEILAKLNLAETCGQRTEDDSPPTIPVTIIQSNGLR